ncbi:hypothetical protein DFH27DRAFT_607834 [Peziza echinospora]|nr:hypothetical protein DFH27DRAFT_607834 [Peziza echinospora]
MQFRLLEMGQPDSAGLPQATDSTDKSYHVRSLPSDKNLPHQSPDQISERARIPTPIDDDGSTLFGMTLFRNRPRLRAALQPAVDYRKFTQPVSAFLRQVAPGWLRPLLMRTVPSRAFFRKDAWNTTTVVGREQHQVWENRTRSLVARRVHDRRRLLWFRVVGPSHFNFSPREGGGSGGAYPRSVRSPSGSVSSNPRVFIYSQ